MLRAVTDAFHVKNLITQKFQFENNLCEKNGCNDNHNIAPESYDEKGLQNRNDMRVGNKTALLEIFKPIYILVLVCSKSVPRFTNFCLLSKHPL